MMNYLLDRTFSTYNIYMYYQNELCVIGSRLATPRCNLNEKFESLYAYKRRRIVYLCTSYGQQMYRPTVDIYYNSTIIFLVPQSYHMQAVSVADVSAETALSVFLLSSINEIVLYCIVLKKKFRQMQ